MLPNNPVNQERLEWLATAIRKFKGEASVLQIQEIDDLSPRALQEQFRQARAADYEAIMDEAKKLKPSATGISSQLVRLRRRYEEVVAIDFFESPLRRRTDQALRQIEQPQEKSGKGKPEMASKADYQNRTWMTRPRPGIDRVSSAWLIARFIDPKAAFIFGSDPKEHTGAIPFDMYQADGFGHDEDRCTFETICRRFGIKDKAVLVIAEAIHDADLEDERFGRSEGVTINTILGGWDRQGLSDEELLKRGTELMEGLYLSLSRAKR